MILAYLIGGIFLIGAFIYVVVFLREEVKNKRNPVPLTINIDKRFCETKNIYSHKAFDIKRG